MNEKTPDFQMPVGIMVSGVYHPQTQNQTIFAIVQHQAGHVNHSKPAMASGSDMDWQGLGQI